jgi:hypothetical protein
LHGAPFESETEHVAEPLQVRTAQLSETHETAVPAQTPPPHTSPYVQALPSSQDTPFE